MLTVAGWGLCGGLPRGPATFQRAEVLLAFQPAGPGLEIGRQVLPACAPKSRARPSPATSLRRGACPLCLSFIVTHELARVPPANLFRASHLAKAFGDVKD
ncbi:hypothetical protein CROQUDRAFT_91741 [Cronartium quercuum f. sp. fusiforme G11]|uniref:Uncharacterized protein n=1 Tax=Cronartium quercuum f. sp. fusiforme G11 TaxID=708437 RepID=A0A9P6TCT4_9BASI|nr:hypothetical protein CROQUDRAFT_91741 [Cronartium quercuum f. sp. fusiforme G11]